ncbi:MAG: phytanoyl-CoA dioxygenase family protein [Planctomycetes bacterium]|nr:phytanoyl-CoA dioxygenase family protein [Planctomycetota bacterium]
MALTACELDAYRQHGFVVRRSVFTASEMAGLTSETERLLTDCRDLIDPGNLRCRFMPHHETGEKLFEVFDPVNDISPLCARLTADERLVGIVETIMGEAACLFKEKLIFKPAGALGYNLHQDIPRYWPGFPRTFLTVLIPIDAATAENGCTEVYSGYHHEFLAPADRPDLYMLPEECVNPARRVQLELAPGDVAIFHGLTPHRSAPNRSAEMRRAFYVSYNARSDGGDQREQHYREFQERLRSHWSSQTAREPYFR